MGKIYKIFCTEHVSGGKKAEPIFWSYELQDAKKRLEELELKKSYDTYDYFVTDRGMAGVKCFLGNWHAATYEIVPLDFNFEETI